MLCDVTLCYAMLCYGMICNVMLCFVMLCYAIVVMICNVILWSVGSTEQRCSSTRQSDSVQKYCNICMSIYIYKCTYSYTHIDTYIYI